MAAPSVWKLRDLWEHMSSGPKAHINGIWVPARPLGLYSLSNRLRCAWLVFTGKADALVWDEPAEKEG